MQCISGLCASFLACVTLKILEHHLVQLGRYMPKVISTVFRRKMEKPNRVFPLFYCALILLSLHWSLVIYVNSSLLAEFVSGETVSALYVIGSLFSLVMFFHMPLFLRRVGNYRLTIFLTLLEVLSVCGMAIASSAVWAVIFFIAHFVLVPLILFNLDVFMEGLIGSQEKETGSKRGLYLSLLSLATAVGPLLTGTLVGTEEAAFTLVYVASALVLIPFLFIIMTFLKDFKNPTYTLLSLPSMVRIFMKQRDTRNIVIISTFLQLFFTWMTIYTPLYLSHVALFSWRDIGLIMFVGLSAYVIFEYPIGIIADKFIGEKEMMAFGFMLMAVTTSWFAFIPQAPIGVWMIAMFLTRVGASFVESTSESYFFKHNQEDDTHKISLYRMTRPLSSIIGAVLGSIALYYMQFNLLFIFLGFLMIPGVFFTMLLKDTK